VRVAALAALVELVAIGCAGPGGNRPVKDVAIKGNHAYGDGDIIDHLATQPPQGWLIKTPEDFDPVGLQLDRGRVEAFYHERGYFSARVTDVNVQRVEGNGVKVTITVEEGEPTRIASIDVQGPENDVAKRVFTHERDTPRKGDVFQHPDYLLAKDMLQKELVKRGYAHAQVDGVVEVDRDKHQAIVRYDIDPGPIVTFGDTKVEGLKSMPESMVRNRISWRRGEQFDPDRLAAAQGRLTASGFFAAARSEYSHDGRPPVADITVRVAEASKHELRFGFGAGLDREQYQLRLRGGYTVRGVFDDELTTFKVDATPGYSWFRSTGSSGPTIQTLAELTRDDFIIGNLRGIADAGFERTPRQGYILTGPRFSLGVQYPFVNDDLRLRVGWEIRETTFDNYDPMVFSGEAIVQWIAYFQQRLIYDKRDYPLQAREGFYAEVETLEGGPWAGGQVGAYRITPEARRYVPLGSRIVLAARVKGGKLWIAADGDAPLPLRYYGGGANDHRGFGFERLSPQRRDSSGNLVPIGGSEVFLGSFETRVDLFKLSKNWVSAVGFLDAGDVTAPGGMDLGNLHYAVGLGLRYDTIVGPVRADVGFRLNRWQAAGADGLANPDPGDRYAIHLSLGEAF